MRDYGKGIYWMKNSQGIKNTLQQNLVNGGVSYS